MEGETRVCYNSACVLNHGFMCIGGEDFDPDDCKLSSVDLRVPMECASKSKELVKPTTNKPSAEITLYNAVKEYFDYGDKHGWQSEKVADYECKVRELVYSA